MKTVRTITYNVSSLHPFVINAMLEDLNFLDLCKAIVISDERNDEKIIKVKFNENADDNFIFLSGASLGISQQLAEMEFRNIKHEKFSNIEKSFREAEMQQIEEDYFANLDEHFNNGI